MCCILKAEPEKQLKGLQFNFDFERDIE